MLGKTFHTWSTVAKHRHCFSETQNPPHQASEALSPAALPFSDDIWEKIIDTAKLSPFQLLALHTSNRQMWRITSSNQLWRPYVLAPHVHHHTSLLAVLQQDMSSQQKDMLKKIWRGTFRPRLGDIQAIRHNRSTAYNLAKQHPKSIRFLSEKYRADKAIVLAAVEKNGQALEYANTALYDDAEVILAASHRYPHAYAHASRRLQEDKVLALNILKKRRKESERTIAFFQNTTHIDDIDLQKPFGGAEFFQFFSEKLRNDKAFVLEVLKFDSRMLKYASPQLQADKHVVLLAVQGNRKALRFANPALQSDPEILLAAMRQAIHHKTQQQAHAYQIEFENWQYYFTDDDLIDRFLDYDDAFVFNQKHITYDSYDTSAISKIVKQHAEAYQITSILERRRFTDKHAIFAILRGKLDASETLRNIGATLRRDKDFMRNAIELDSRLIQYVDVRLRDDTVFMRDIIKMNHRLISYTGKIPLGDKNFMQHAITLDGLMLRYASPELRANKALVQKAMRQNSLAIQYASQALQGDHDILKIAISQALTCNTQRRERIKWIGIGCWQRCKNSLYNFKNKRKQITPKS